jgi:hypothetical protein
LNNGKPVVRVDRLYLNNKQELVWMEDKNADIGAPSGYFEGIVKP